MNLLSVENVCFSYQGSQDRRDREDRKHDVLHNINFNVKAGEHIAIVGPNGCGKTTLFQLLSGFFTPTQGTILFEGKKISAIPASELARRLSVVPQGNRFNFPYSALETVLMGLFPHRSRFERTSNTDLENARDIMQQACVWEFADTPVTELSGGQAQRIILVRALLQALPPGGSGENRTDDRREEGGFRSEGGIPPHNILLLDEAFSELDIAARLAMMTLVDAAVKKRALTVICIHHDLHLAHQFADRVIALHHGAIVADGAPDTVFTEEFFARIFSVKAEIIRGKGFLFEKNF